MIVVEIPYVKSKDVIPSEINSPLFVLAYDNQETGTMHMNQGRTEGTHKKSSAEHGSSHDQEEWPRSHSKIEILVKIKLKTVKRLLKHKINE